MFRARSIQSSLSIKDKILSIDYILVISIFILGLTSILAMYSTDGGELKYHTKSHILRFFVFFSMFLTLSFIQIRFWHSQSYLIYILFFILLLGVKYFGLTSSGSKRWLDLYFMNLQPSELMKIGLILFLALLTFSCVGTSSVGIFGSGVSVAYDPRTVGMQIDDSIMQKNLIGRLTLTDKKYIISISAKVLDGNIYLSGKVDEPEEKLKIIKMAWETKGARSVQSTVTIKGNNNFKSTAKDILITSQLRTALIFNKLTKATNYTIDTINGKIYIFGIAMTKKEKEKVISEADQIHGVKDVIPSIYLVEELSRNKN